MAASRFSPRSLARVVGELLRAAANSRRVIPLPLDLLCAPEDRTREQIGLTFRPR